jgi:hypothetical protein
MRPARRPRNSALNTLYIEENMYLRRIREAGILYKAGWREVGRQGGEGGGGGGREGEERGDVVNSTH